MTRGSYTGVLIPEEKLTRFITAYLNCGFNAVQAGIAIGMSKRSAQVNSHRYVAAIRHRLSIQQALREAGLDARRLAQKLDKFMDATEPKWNLATKSWDTFENCAAQLEAIKQMARLLNL